MGVGGGGGRGGRGCAFAPLPMYGPVKLYVFFPRSTGKVGFTNCVFLVKYIFLIFTIIVIPEIDCHTIFVYVNISGPYAVGLAGRGGEDAGECLTAFTPLNIGL